jgi:predicted patatin/cPLA2 family phospholipase
MFETALIFVCALSVLSGVFISGVFLGARSRATAISDVWYESHKRLCDQWEDSNRQWSDLCHRLIEDPEAKKKLEELLRTTKPEKLKSLEEWMEDVKDQLNNEREQERS